MMNQAICSRELLLVFSLVNHLIIDNHSLYEVKGSEKIELFIASPQGYYYSVFPPLITKSSGFLNKIKPEISCLML
jgi:hypothetical protein